MKEEIKEIFDRIDRAIDSSLTKAICKSFIEEYEWIKRSYN